MFIFAIQHVEDQFVVKNAKHIPYIRFAVLNTMYMYLIYKSAFDVEMPSPLRNDIEYDKRNGNRYKIFCLKLLKVC